MRLGNSGSAVIHIMFMVTLVLFGFMLTVIVMPIHDAIADATSGGVFFIPASDVVNQVFSFMFTYGLVWVGVFGLIIWYALRLQKREYTVY